MKSSFAALLALIMLLDASAPARATESESRSVPRTTDASTFWTPRTRLTTGLLIGSALAAGAAVAFGLAAVSEQNNVNADHLALGGDTGACLNPTPAHVSPCADLRSSLPAQNTFAFAQYGSYVAAGGMFLGAVATYLLWPHSREKQATVLPYANPTSRSAGIVVSF